MINSAFTRHICAAVLAAWFMSAFASSAHAQGFVSPLLGYDFGGDSSCPTMTGCEDRKRNLGVSFGSLGPLFGSEFEIATASDFFGGTDVASSSVRTMMANVLLAPKFGPLRPYGLMGVGLFRAKVELPSGSDDEITDNHFGWDVGGGVMVFFGRHFGIRGDLRYFHALQDLELAGITLEDGKLDFGRAAAAVVLGF